MAGAMIERVAREMFRQRRRDQGAAYFGGQDEVETDWLTVKSLYIADARAVIAAMREPTDPMETAAIVAPNYLEDQTSRRGFHNMWNAAIDAALVGE